MVSSPSAVNYDAGRASRSRRMLVSIVAVCAFTIVVHALIATFFHLNSTPATTSTASTETKRGEKNLFFLIGDGFGPAAQGLTRIMRHEARKLRRSNKISPNTAGSRLASDRYDFDKFKKNTAPDDDRRSQFMLPLDDILIGSVITESSSSTITDSAAGATAYSCGIRTTNDYVAVDSKFKPCASLLEAAKLARYRTGVVTTTDVTDATPAAFTAHAASRRNSKLIFEQQMKGAVDLLLGGGKSHYDEYIKAGNQAAPQANVFTDISQITSTDLPAIGLFAPYDIDHVLDHNDSDEKSNPSTSASTSAPKLLEMVQAATQRLERACSQDVKCPGIVLIIEQGHIDIAAHWSDTASVALETLELQTVVEHMIDYVDRHPGSLLLSTADHETGGISIGAQLDENYPAYEWFPQNLFGQRHSVTWMANDLKNRIENNQDFSSSPNSMEDYVKYVNENLAAKKDFTEDKIKPIVATTLKYGQAMMLGDLVRENTGVGFATHGHSAVDVNLYGYGAVPDKLRGVNENIDVGNYLFEFLQIERFKPQVEQKIAKIDVGKTTI